MKVYKYKTKRAKKYKEVKADSEEEALNILEAVGIDTVGIDIITAKNSTNPKKEKLTPAQKLYNSLDDSAKQVALMLEDNGVLDKDFITKDKIKNFNLKENTHLPYYIFIYWGSGNCGYFADENKIKNDLIDKLNRSYDDGFDFTIYDNKNLKYVDFHASEENIKLKFNGKWI